MSDIYRLQHRYIILKKEESKLCVRIHARTPKESQVKSILVGEHSNRKICPVQELIPTLSNHIPYAPRQVQKQLN